MNVLVDTSVWIDHFRHGNDDLVNLLGRDQVLTHPMVILEIACGTPPAPRLQTLNNMELLRLCNQVSMAEAMVFIEQEALYGLGCGLVDIMLLASTLITPGSSIWTLDKRLMILAERFDVAYQTSRH